MNETAIPDNQNAPPKSESEATFDAPLGSAICASIAPSNAHKSRRREQLSRDARDLLAYAFAAGLPASEILPIPMTAAEVLIGPGDVGRIMMGGGFHRHGGSDSLRYFKHADDEQWALIFSHDCDGDPERGAQLLASYSPNESSSATAAEKRST